MPIPNKKVYICVVSETVRHTYAIAAHSRIEANKVAMDAKPIASGEGYSYVGSEHMGYEFQGAFETYDPENDALAGDGFSDDSTVEPHD